MISLKRVLESDVRCASSEALSPATSAGTKRPICPMAGSCKGIGRSVAWPGASPPASLEPYALRLDVTAMSI